MNGFIDLHHPILQALGIAVLHSFWQGILVYFLVKMILSFVPEHKSGARYGVAYCALAILFFGFLFSFFTEWQLVSNTAQASSVTRLTGALQHSSSVSVLALWNQVLSFRYIHLFQSYMPLIAVFYAAGVLLLCAKMLWNIIQVQYLRKQVMLPDSLLQQRFLQLKDQAGVRGNVLLRFSEKVNVPVMFGYLKPVILLPFSLISRLDTQQLETILLHELAHIKRNDYFWNLLQMVMETLMFFNPAAWFLSRIIRLEREHRCDDYVLKITKTPLPYAHALLLLEENRASVAGTVMAATGNNKTSLLNRIKRMTAMKQENRNSQRTLATVSVLVLVAAMICFATAFGQEKKQEAKPKVITKSYGKKTITVIDDDGNKKTYQKVYGDTSGLEEAMKAVPMAMEMANEALKGIDMKEIGNTVALSMAHASKAMKEIDWDDIQAKVDDAMKEAHKSMKDIEWDKINAEVSAEMADAKKEMAQAMKKAQIEMKDVDWDEIHKAVDEAKEEMKKAGIEMKKANIEMKKSMKEAKESVKEDE
jgi:beta-lactamase regulating signal transducer with metallopeptidase domain